MHPLWFYKHQHDNPVRSQTVCSMSAVMVSMAVLIRSFSSGIHTHPVSWNCAYHLRMELSDDGCFPNLVRNCRWTIVPRQSFWITLYCTIHSEVGYRRWKSWVIFKWLGNISKLVTHFITAYLRPFWHKQTHPALRYTAVLYIYIYIYIYMSWTNIGVTCAEVRLNNMPVVFANMRVVLSRDGYTMSIWQRNKNHNKDMNFEWRLAPRNIQQYQSLVRTTAVGLTRLLMLLSGYHDNLPIVYLNFRWFPASFVYIFCH